MAERVPTAGVKLTPAGKAVPSPRSASTTVYSRPLPSGTKSSGWANALAGSLSVVVSLVATGVSRTSTCIEPTTTVSPMRPSIPLTKFTA